jgi:NTP pyrophosphatase (non-canonical NTP hydrolase)
MTVLEQTVLQEALDTWGFDAQLMMVIEESGELVQAAAKFLGGRERSSKGLIEELADMSLMIDQMRLQWGEEIDAARNYKLNRLAQRLRLDALLPKKATP